MLPGILMTAAGFGLALPTASFVVTAGVPPRQRGVAGGLFVSSLQVGSAVGLAMLATTTTATTTAAAARTADTGTLADGYRLAYLIAVGLVALAALTLVTAPALRRAKPR